MRAIQVMWSLPVVASQKLASEDVALSRDSKMLSHALVLRDYEILLLVLALSKWKKINGTVKLYTDTLWAEQLKRLNLLDLWNEYDTNVLDAVDNSRINANIFWAGGKFYAYLHEPAPFVIFDLDFIIWRDLTPLCEGFDLRFTHWEQTETSVFYPSQQNLRRPVDYQFKSDWRWDCLAANAAVVYFGNEQLKNDYATEALRFVVDNMLDSQLQSRSEPELLFAEQRLLSMVAAEKNAITKPFLETIWDPLKSAFTIHDASYGRWYFDHIEPQPLFTHVWVIKPKYNQNINKRIQYCRRLVRVILREFPEQMNRLKTIDVLQPYV